MGQPSTSAQVRAVALREAVASCPAPTGIPLEREMIVMGNHERYIIQRAETFASYIENGVEVDPNA